MPDFLLHPTLAEDCIVLGNLENNLLLLINNSLVPWFILVPKTRHSVTELYDLSMPDQQQVLNGINTLSKFIKARFNPDKLNIGAIGNVVPQLHIHVIGRYQHDACWPKPVWGNLARTAYSNERITEIRTWLTVDLGEKLLSH
ncbi:MAG: HIT family protein [Gammaproteobacteria bacterium]|nr:HIT family protein [Gammaproteobacteria bacterium]